MKKNIQKILCTMLAMLMMFTIAPISGFVGVEASAAETTSGTCGDDAYWQFEEETGTLVISGEGAIYDAATIDEETGDFAYDEETGECIITSPWYSFKDEITTLVIEEGITQIGMLAFYNCFYLTDVSLPSTLETVCVGAFCNCIRLEKLNFPEGVKNIYYGNYDEMAVKNIVFPASLENLVGFELNEGDFAFNFNMCVYLESVTIPAEVGAVSAIVDLSNPSIRNIYNNSMEALIKFDVSDYWWGDEATAEYMTVTMGAVLETIEYEMTEEEQQTFVLERVTAYYDEYYDGIIPEPVYSETVPDYITVYCYANSAQHTYCVENDINYVLLDGHIHTDSDGDSVCNICGYENMCGEKVYYEFEEETGTLTISGEGAMYNYDSYQGNYSPFYCDKSVVSVIVNEGVTTISSTLFANCNGIETVSLPESLSEICENAFDFCYNIEWFYVDENNEHFRTDEYGVLYENNTLRLYPIGNTMIEYSIPEGVNFVRGDGINEAEHLEIIYIPASMVGLPDASFSNCNNLEKIIVDKNNEYYFNDDYGALYRVDSEMGKTTLKCYPKGNKSSVFAIADGTNTIWHSVFNGMTEINTLIIPSSVTEAVWGAFQIHDLTNIYYYGTEEQWNEIDIDEENDEYLEGVTIHFNYDGTSPIITKRGSCGDNVTYELYSDGTLIISGEGEMYDFTWDANAGSIPSYVDSKYDFEADEIIGDIFIKKVIIEDGVTTIGNYAFNACRALENVEIADTVTSIGETAFDYCTSLKEVVIPDSVTSIGIEAFSESALESITLSENLETIGDIAFFCCENLKEIVIPESVTSIGVSAFGMCSSLESITILNKNCELADMFIFDAVIDDETGDITPVELKAVVKGYTDSTAQIYAEKMTEAGYATKFEAIDAHVHTPVTYTQEASCTVNGYTLTTCAECLERLSYEIIEATGHIEGEVVIENKLEPTCTKSGSYDKVIYCSACGEELSRVTEVEYALGHSYSVGIVVTPATLVSEGYGYKECERCDERIDYVIPMLEGTVSKDTSKDISVEYLDEAYDGNMQIKVEEDFTGSQYLTQSYTKFESWNIKTYVNGVKVQPDVPVLVTLPLPAGYNQATVAVYHINSATGKLEKMSPLYFEDGYVKFLASSFSVYMVVNESSVEELDPSDDCSCNCHKSGFMGFIWKILRFFYKLFKTNKVCGCGVAHY